MRLLEDDWRSEERLRRMNLVVEVWSVAEDDWVLDPARDTAVDIAGDVLTHCELVLAETAALDGCGDVSEINGCAYPVCLSQLELCRALTLRQMAEGVSAVELLVPSGSSLPPKPGVRVGQQDPESLVALWQASQYAAMRALGEIGDGLLGSACVADLNSPFGFGSGTLAQTTGELLASSLVEAVDLGEHAAEEGARGALGIADRDRAGISNLGTAARLSWFDENLSRLVAVQTHVGGLDASALATWTFRAGDYTPDETAEYYRGSIVDSGIGAQPECTGSCATAQETIRFAGASFESLLSPTVELDTYVSTYMGPRLAARVGAGIYDTTSASTLAASIGVSRDALVEARAWMRHEAEVFARPTDQLAPTPPLPPEPDGTPGSTMLAFDATTMSRPTAPPAIHYLTAARQSGAWNGFSSVAPSPGATASPARPPLRPERAYLFDYAHSVAREALAGGNLAPEARGVLATITQMANARRALQVELCNHPDINFAGKVRVRVTGLSAAPASGDFVIVKGTTMLRCMTEGVVEGVPCTASGLVAPSSSWAPVTGRSSRRRAVEWTIDADASGQYRYLLRRRPGREGPGAYESIAGFSLELPGGTNLGDCTTIPYDFTSDEMSQGYFAMSGDDLAPERACDGMDLNAPIPLEDIVIDDGDPWEDSWAHHLQVAAEAAAHSDLLGQQLLEAGLEMDRRGEAAVDAIVELCGAPVNLDALFDRESGSLVELVHPTDTCSESAGTACTDSRYECVGTACVMAGVFGDAESFDRSALMACLGLDASGGESTVPIVALGERPLCVWRNQAAREHICQGAPEGSCPYPVPNPSETTVADACGEPEGFDPMIHEMVLVTDDGSGVTGVVIEPGLLGLIGSVSGGSDDDPETHDDNAIVRPTANQCDEIRRLRALGLSSGDLVGGKLGIIREGGFFEIENVRRWAARIGWRGYPRNHSEITLDGAPWSDSSGNALGSTGFPFDLGGREYGIPGVSPTWTTTTPWPCAAYSGIAAAGTGLFRDTIDCSDEAARATFNWRMGRAVATLAALSGQGLGELQLPAYYNIEVSMNETGGLTVTDYAGKSWRLINTADFGGQTIAGWIVAPVNSSDEILVWSGRGDRTFGSQTGNTYEVSTVRPFGFLRFGTRVTDDNMDRANSIARTLWEGLGDWDYDNRGGTSAESHFFGVVQVPVDTRLELGRSPRPHQNNMFVRALLRRGESLGAQYMNHGRNSLGQSNFNHLSNLFGAYPYDLGNEAPNLAHLFADTGTSYGAFIARGDLLDAMELMCQVAATIPEADVPPAEPREPVVLSMADIGSVQIYAERVADRIDNIARRQVVQEVPLDVVMAMLGDSSGGEHPTAGAYGDLTRRLTIALRSQGNAPRDIARALRDISTALNVMRRNEQRFNNQVALEYLNMVTRMLSATLACVGANTVLTGYACGVAAVISILDGIATQLSVDNLGLDFQNQFDEFVQRLGDDFDLIEFKQMEMENAADEVRRILGELRSARIGAQSAVARALFADSDAAGRHYPVNTAMRRVYDINLHRYRAAQRAAQRMAAVARMAVEQRFGVDLEAQECATLVDPPASWAADVCNTTGVNYAEIRDPNVEIGEDAIRRMFVGDYVRRLQHYTESYRFDFPYTSGEDVMVVSVRDDLLRPRGRCVEPVLNQLGASNDLLASVLPTPAGDLGSSGDLAWHVPEGGCDADPVTGVTTNCLQVLPVDGPRVSVDGSLGPPAPVPGRIAGESPRGFEVVFAPGAPSHYTDDAALVQDVVLSPGIYRLSWYQLGTAEPSVDARTTVIVPSGADVYNATERAMSGGWLRKFLMFEAPSTGTGTLYHIGIFPAEMEPTPHAQGIIVAGLQLENVTSTPAAAVFGTANEGLYGPTVFTATTAPGWGAFDGCETSDPSAFRNAWNYRCANLCSGGFQSEGCTEGEEPQTYCYWETVFSLDEERLVGRGDSFGGGFAFGNFNYRTGDVAVNVVGTGVRDCDGLRGDACYTTAGIPFSFSHGPSGVGSDMSAYTVRAHDGSLHPVHLFRGQIESGRALAAERYLTNPLSSADTALINDYVRTELRGRPMSGTYRLILWDVPGFDFHRVEDVQILWRYRYFTRTGSRLVCEG